MFGYDAEKFLNGYNKLTDVNDLIKDNDLFEYFVSIRTSLKFSKLYNLKLNTLIQKTRDNLNLLKSTISTLTTNVENCRDVIMILNLLGIIIILI